MLRKAAKLYAYVKAPKWTFVTLHPIRTLKVLTHGIVALPLGVWIGKKLTENDVFTRDPAPGLSGAPGTADASGDPYSATGTGAGAAAARTQGPASTTTPGGPGAGTPVPGGVGSSAPGTVGKPDATGTTGTTPPPAGP